MKKIHFVFSLLLFVGVAVASVPDGIQISRTAAGYTINLTLPEYSLTPFTNADNNFLKVGIPGYGVTADIGRPALPKITFNLVINENEGTPGFQLVNKKVEDALLKEHVYPFQAPYRRDLLLANRPFNFDSRFYNSTGNQRPPFIEISEPFYISGVKGVTVTIYPFNYIPSAKRLDVTRTATINITTNRAVARDNSHSEVYTSFLNSFFANYEFGSVRQIKNYLIITAPEYEAGLASFVNHKTSGGYNVAMFTTSAAGTTTTAIKAFIQQRYNDPGLKPEFVLLVGDVDKIPAWTGSGEGSPKTDLNYALLQGTDYYADVFIGRFSITNATELANIINKTIYMENNIATLAKDNVYMASQDNYSITEGTHNFVISTYFQPNGFNNLKLYSNSGATTTQLIAALNANKMFAVYSGHGSESSWADGPVLSQSQVRALTNTVFPFVYSFACVTGSYHLAECFGETWIRTATGASSFYGSSVNSYWDEDDILERKLFQSMFVDNLTKVTPMFDMGKYLTTLHFGNIGPGTTMLRYLEMYNLMGDPSLETKRVIPPDQTAPDPVTNLAAGNSTSNSVTLSWTAPYDSTFGGVQAYDIRYSTSVIANDNDFNNATSIIFAGQSDTLGTPKSFCITGLAFNTNYHFAIKAMDMWSNKSTMSNVTSSSTLAAPMVAVSPGNISHVLGNQTQVVDTVYISNASLNQSTLDYTVEFENSTYPSKSIEYSFIHETPQAEKIDDKNNPASEHGQSYRGSGGPDLFGYKWIDSDDPQGPDYVWEDISTTGTQVASWTPTGTMSATDEGYAGPLNLGFNFKYYGQAKSQIFISTNGLLTFSPISTNIYSNATIPTAAEPNEIICPFWDDLDAKAPGTVHYKQDGNRFIIQWTNYQRYSGTASYTWQVVIYSSGKILFYFNSMSGTLDGATTGIENGAGNDGLQLSYNSTFVKNNFAVKLAAEPEWIIPSGNLAGTLHQGNRTGIIITIRTEDFNQGNYSMDMMVRSNCGIHPLVTVPISVTLSAIPVELTSFEAETVRDEVILKWRTASETNNLGFAVERKDNTKGIWNNLSFIDGKGTTTQTSDYSFRDKNLRPGSYEYRIKQTDLNGDVSFSNPLKVEVGLPDEFALYQNYPNPFNPTTTISFAIPYVEGITTQSVNLTVYDALGNEMATLVNGEKEAGIYKTELNCSNFASGIYFYKLSAGKFTAIRKFVVLK
ncbi:MAG: T9SS type A sorting domain-containing protein [Ignavibacteriaceae bacterium]|nr:T9SS type A sorting domain-containing protein [Ignavibacteriaceae bacterium]